MREYMKNRIIHLVALTLTLCMVLGLVSCNNQSSDEEEVNEDVYDTLISNGNSEHSYAIVRSEGASEEEAELVSELSKKIYDATGYAIGVNTDFEREGTQFVRGDYEILVGVTNRDESQELSSLPYRDWAITYQTTRVAIYAKTIDSLSDAIDYFTANYLDISLKTLSLPKNLNYVNAFDYDVKTFNINGASIEDYRIVATSKDSLLAYSLADAIGRVCGCLLPVESVASTQNKNIIIGTATVEASNEMKKIGFDEYLIISMDNGDLIIGSDNLAYDSEYAISMFLKDFIKYSVEESKYYGEVDKIELLSLSSRGKIMDEKLGGLINADAEYLAGVDAKANALRTSVLDCDNTINPTTFGGTVYYVSNNGNDSNNGKSPSEAWASLEKVNSADISYGSAVLFERGGVWRGCLKTKTGVTYSSYGDGNKPCIYGSPENGTGPEKWTLKSGTNNIWVYYKDLNDVGEIVFNDGSAWAKRVYFRYDPNSSGEWKYKTYFDGKKLVIDEVLDENLKFFSAAYSSKNTSGLPNFGTGDFTNVGKVYLRCDEGNPGEVFESIEFCTYAYTSQSSTYGHIVSLPNGVNNVTIDNLCIKYGAMHGIGGGNNNGIRVTNCEIGWIGGGVQTIEASNDYKTVALGNGVEITRDCQNFYVHNNWIYQCYDTGITNQTNHNNGNRIVENIEYSNNLIEYCDMSFEIWMGGSNDMATTHKMKNLLIENNICRFAGYGFSVQRPNYTVGAHISAAWGGAGATNNPAENYIIRNNIFDRTNGDITLLWMTAGKEEWLPTWEGNTFVQTYGYKFGRVDTKSDNELTLKYCSVFSKANYDFNIANYIKTVLNDSSAEIAVVVNK